MINKSELKVGDKITAMYWEGFARSSNARTATVTVSAIDDEYITVKMSDNSERKFVNDETMSYTGTRYSHTQFYRLFLGTEEEAKKSCDELEKKEEILAEMQDYMYNFTKLPLKECKRFLKLLKSVDEQ